MATIFRIKQLDAKLEIAGVEYKIHDPNYMVKNSLSQEAWEFEKNKANMTPAEQQEALRKGNMALLKSYLPDIPDDVLNNLGTGALSSLMNHLLKLSQENFGAIVEQVEKKPEAQA